MNRIEVYKDGFLDHIEIYAKGIKYEYIPYSEFRRERLPVVEVSKREKYLKIGAAFDIETTSYHSKKYDEDLATMYVWQFGLGDLTIIGRYWYEFQEFIEILSEWAGSLGGKLLVLDHNFSFEFAFIKGLFQWNINEKTLYPEIFAKSPRDILYAKYKNIEFRDTLALTDMGLSRLQKNYGLSVGKLNGDLDYSVMRHSESELTPEELSYCINDTRVLVDFFDKYLLKNYIEEGIKIPLTSTGEVRIDIKNNFFEMTKEEKKKMRNALKNAQPSKEMYLIFRSWLFRGGLVHANIEACNYLIDTDDCVSMDLKSAHPTHLLLDSFPWKFYRRNINKWKEVLKESRKGTIAFFGVFEFYNIRVSTCHTLESKNKIIECAPDAVFENGRLVKSSFIKVALTELDYENYEDLMCWDKIKVCCIYEAEKKPLPDYLRKTVLKYFIKKESLERDTPDYNSAKRRLNSTFGCCATSLPERELVYNFEEKDFEPSEVCKDYTDLIKGLYLLPQWAIWIAAGTRRDIVRSIKACGSDSYYYDTDSNKVNNYSEHKEWFDNFNKERMEAVSKMNTYDFDKSVFSKLGTFQKEYSIEKLKVLGAKRYIAQHDGEVQVTVAGMTRGSLENYCKCNNLDIWEEFQDSLTLPEEWSMKNTSVYCDCSFDDELTDYEGKTLKIHEESSCSIIPIPFTMNVEQAFLERIKERMEERQIAVYQGVL